MESQLEKEARFCQLMAHSSHDSAIDTDSLEWETEVVEFEKDRVRIEQFFLRNNILNKSGKYLGIFRLMFSSFRKVFKSIRNTLYFVVLFCMHTFFAEYSNYISGY